MLILSSKTCMGMIEVVKRYISFLTMFTHANVRKEMIFDHSIPCVMRSC